MDKYQQIILRWMKNEYFLSELKVGDKFNLIKEIEGPVYVVNEEGNSAIYAVCEGVTCSLPGHWVCIKRD